MEQPLELPLFIAAAEIDPVPPPFKLTVAFWQTATGGVLKRVITTSSCASAQTPFNKVHRNVFAPAPSPVTPLLGLVGAVMEPAPETKDQVPPPVVGEFPASVAEVAQTVWFGPALAFVN